MDLPNNDWVRSTKKPEYAICLDFEHDCFGWKMVEGADDWQSVEKLTVEEVAQAMEMPEFSAHQSQLRTLHKLYVANLNG